MLETFRNLRLKAVACALPSRQVEVASFVPRFGEQVVSRFREVVGVDAFPVADASQSTSTLAEAAARHLIQAGRVDPKAVDALLFVTQTPDAVAPATSALLQHRLALPETCFALDINQGCSGFLSALVTASHFLANDAVRNVLILGGDTLSRLVDPADHTSAMLFGDAGFAALVGREAQSASSASPWIFATATSGSNAIEIPFGGAFKMAGTDVFNFTITRVPEQIQEVLKASGERGTDLDWLLLHQANAFILRQVARMCAMPEAKVPCRMRRRGNTSSASLPLLLCDLASEGVTGIQKAILSAFGVGLSWITLRADLDFSCFLPPIECPSSDVVR